jgi:hypothetical protein
MMALRFFDTKLSPPRRMENGKWRMESGIALNA